MNFFCSLILFYMYILPKIRQCKCWVPRILQTKQCRYVQGTGRALIIIIAPTAPLLLQMA